MVRELHRGVNHMQQRWWMGCKYIRTFGVQQGDCSDIRKVQFPDLDNLQARDRQASASSTWIIQTIAYLRENYITKFTPTTHAASPFKKHIDELCSETLIPQADSWYI